MYKFMTIYEFNVPNEALVSKLSYYTEKLILIIYVG